jgi:hypothetical protein
MNDGYNLCYECQNDIYNLDLNYLDAYAYPMPHTVVGKILKDSANFPKYWPKFDLEMKVKVKGQIKYMNFLTFVAIIHEKYSFIIITFAY